MNTMQFRLLTPTEVLVDAQAVKIIAEAQNGLFCLLPRHVDFVAALVPGILYYTTEAGEDRLVAVDEGALVKCGEEVLVSAVSAVAGTDLGLLQSTVVETFLELNEEERHVRSVMARLESGAVRRLLELERQGHG